MKILVTGGAGFIGSNFIRHLIKKYPGYKIINLDKLNSTGILESLKDIEGNENYQSVQGDICDFETVEKVMEEVEAVFNFAAESHTDRLNFDPGGFVKTDVFGTYVLLEVARKFNIKRFIQVSSDEVYGETESIEGVERPSIEADPLNPKTPYAASKAGADQMAYSFFATYKMPVVVTRCSNNFGPYQHPEKLIPLFITNAIDNRPLPIFGEGKNIRDWIFVLDHCEALDAVLHAKEVEGEIFNIGASCQRSILKITELILSILGKPKELIEFVEERLGHVRHRAVDPTKIKEKLGWKAKTDFNKAMEETIRWYVENEEWWRRVKVREEALGGKS